MLTTLLLYVVCDINRKFFYNRLVSFMSSGPVHCHVLAGEGAIAGWRSLMGPTKVFKTRYARLQVYF